MHEANFEGCESASSIITLELHAQNVRSKVRY